MTAPPPRREGITTREFVEALMLKTSGYWSGARDFEHMKCAVEELVREREAARDAELAEAKAELAQAKREAEWLRKLIKEGLAIDTEASTNGVSMKRSDKWRADCAAALARAKAIADPAKTGTA